MWRHVECSRHKAMRIKITCLTFYASHVVFFLFCDAAKDTLFARSIDYMHIPKYFWKHCMGDIKYLS